MADSGVVVHLSTSEVSRTGVSTSREAPTSTTRRYNMVDRYMFGYRFDITLTSLQLALRVVTLGFPGSNRKLVSVNHTVLIHNTVALRSAVM